MQGSGLEKKGKRRLCKLGEMNPLNLLSCTILAVVLLLAVATSGGVNAAADTDRITEGHGAPAATAVDRDHGTAVSDLVEIIVGIIRQ